MTEVISMRNILREIRASWWQILIAIVVGVILAFVVLLRTPPTYEASVIIGPKKDFANPGRAAGGLTNLLGSLAGADGSVDLVRLDLLLRSDWAADYVISTPALSRLFFSDRWDEANKLWRPRSGFTARLWSMQGTSLPREPLASEAKAQLARLMSIETQQQTYRVVQLRHTDPKLALAALNMIIQGADEALRSQDAQDIERLIEYTKQRLSEATIGRQAEALSSTLLLLEQQRMNLNASQRYSYQVVQRPRVETAPSAPRPLQYLAIGVFLPFFLMVSLCVIRSR